MTLTTAILCLTANVFFEARSEPMAGQMAVASVTMNRADGERQNVCKEVLKKAQFSWTSDYIEYTKGGVARLSKQAVAIMKKEADAVQKARLVARKALAGKMRDNTFGAKFYHADYVSPSWRHHFSVTSRIGRHIFYR